MNVGGEGTASPEGGHGRVRAGGTWGELMTLHTSYKCVSKPSIMRLDVLADL